MIVSSFLVPSFVKGPLKATYMTYIFFILCIFFRSKLGSFTFIDWYLFMVMGLPGGVDYDVYLFTLKSHYQKSHLKNHISSVFILSSRYKK